MSNPKAPNGRTLATAILGYETSRNADVERNHVRAIELRLAGGVRIQVSDLAVWVSHRELRRMARRLARAYLNLEKIVAELREDRLRAARRTDSEALMRAQFDQLSRSAVAAATAHAQEVAKLKNKLALVTHSLAEARAEREELRAMNEELRSFSSGKPSEPAPVHQGQPSPYSG